MQGTDISVVICLAHGQRDVLPMTLAHLEVQTHPAARFEVLVADLGAGPEWDQTLTRYIDGTPLQLKSIQAHGSTPPAALNKALEAARGRWVLFLDERLLAEPTLVEAHIAAQEQRGGQVVVRGAVQPHPHVQPGAFTTWPEPYHQPEPASARALLYLEWPSPNLCYPRALITEAGGFDEDLAWGGVEHLALAWRLSKKGVEGHYEPAARAYRWREDSIHYHCRRHYLLGYAMYQLIEKTQSTTLEQWFVASTPAWQRLLNRVLAPAALRICAKYGPRVPGSFTFAAAALRHQFAQGYRDARGGRPRAFPSPEV